MLADGAGRVLASGVTSHRGKNTSTSYRPNLIFAYEVNGENHASGFVRLAVLETGASPGPWIILLVGSLAFAVFRGLAGIQQGSR